MSAVVSVIVPCFNGERFVAQTILSALAQGGDLEVIVIDDGSTDQSAAVVGAIADADSRVTLIRGPNQGVANARNTGVRAMSATSRFVLFLDADDVLVQGALGILQRRLEREPALGAVFGSRSRIDADGALIETAPTSIRSYYVDRRRVKKVRLAGTIGYWHVLPVNPISTPGQCLIRVSDLPSGDAFDQQFSPCEDWELWLRLVRRGDIGVEHREILSYRDHDSSASRRYRTMYEQRDRVFETQVDVVRPEERGRLRRAWRFGMFGFDARLCLHWAWARLMARDLRGAARYVLRSLRYDARYAATVIRRRPDVSAVSP